MTTTESKAPSSVSKITVDEFGEGTWADENNIKVNDDTPATFTQSSFGFQPKEALYLNGFAFDIPTNNVIVDMNVRVKGKDRATLPRANVFNVSTSLDGVNTFTDAAWVQQFPTEYDFVEFNRTNALQYNNDYQYARWEGTFIAIFMLVGDPGGSFPLVIDIDYIEISLVHATGEIYAKENGEWKTPSEIHTHNGTSFELVTGAYVKFNGVWVPIPF